MISDEDLYKIIEYADEIKDNNLSEAINLLETTINGLDESSYYYPIAIMELSQYYEDLEDHEKVIVYTKKIISDLKNKKYQIKETDIAYTYYLISLQKLAVSSQIVGNLQQSIDSYNEIITFHENVSTFRNDYSLMSAYHGIGFIQAAISQKKDNEKERIELLRMARSNMKKAIQIDPRFYPFYVHLAVIYNDLGNEKKAIESYIKSLNGPMKEDILKSVFNQKLYKYAPIDKYTILNLINETIYLNDPKKFNDPFDCPIYRGNNYKKNTAFSTVLDKIRITCFSEKRDSILMWSHYADSHRGICIGYQIDDNYCRNKNLHSGFVDYQKENSFSKGIKHFKGLLNDTFYIKNMEWQYENEFRIIGYDLERNILNSPPIKEIIFGLNTTDSDIELVQNIFKAHQEINFLKVKDNKDDNINLVLEELNR